jgi:hypothetical protein
MDDMSKKRTLSDVSDVATHERKSARHDSDYAEVDKQADQAILSSLQGVPVTLPNNSEGKKNLLCVILKMLVEFSPHLNQRYAAFDHAQALMTDAKLSRELEDAWQTGQFANIRRWGEYMH